VALVAWTGDFRFIRPWHSDVVLRRAAPPSTSPRSSPSPSPCCSRSRSSPSCAGRGPAW
jgi:hypothetical protein